MPSLPSTMAHHHTHGHRFTALTALRGLPQSWGVHRDGVDMEESFCNTSSGRLSLLQNQMAAQHQMSQDVTRSTADARQSGR